VIWYFAAQTILAHSSDVYLWDYIILPAIGLFSLTFLADLFVRSPRFSLVSKEYISLTLFIIFSFYLSLTHNIARVLLASFILPIFASTVFLNVKITRWTFWISSLAVLLVGVKIYFSGKLDSNIIMQIFVVCFMFLCSYLLAKVLILYGRDNLKTLMHFDDKQQNMQEQLKLDPFTGLNNKKTFNDHLLRLMEECRNTQKFISLAIIDIDHFKSVNDLYGHGMGDRVILYLSEMLKKIQNENTQAFRIGGDEFSILFKGCRTEETYRTCEYLRTQMSSFPLRTADDKLVTLSCGIVCVDPENADLEMLKNAADSALYAAKANGRDQVVIYNDLVPPISPRPEQDGRGIGWESIGNR
jgi:diguanylate cyclase (GGDEF)-like protein